MSASTSGALKVLLEGAGLGISVYRDQAPFGTVYPYLTVSEGLAVVPDPLEDGRADTGTETVSVDIWMQWKNVTTGALVESYTLPGAVMRVLHGSQLATAPTRAYLVLVRHVGPRLVEYEEAPPVVHIPITVEIRRNL